MNIKRAAKRLLQVIVGDYGYYFVLVQDRPGPPPEGVDSCEIRTITKANLLSCDAEIRARSWLDGEDAVGFGLFIGGELVSMQWYWWGARYADQMGFWPIDSDTACSVDLYTLSRHRGRGYARVLKAASAEAMRKKGFSRLISRVWHNHSSSLRVSESLGWKRVGRVVEVVVLGSRRRFRLKF